jgi:hypothetical protein
MVKSAWDTNDFLLFGGEQDPLQHSLERPPRRGADAHDEAEEVEARLALNVVGDQVKI